MEKRSEGKKIKTKTLQGAIKKSIIFYCNIKKKSQFGRTKIFLNCGCTNRISANSTVYSYSLRFLQIFSSLKSINARKNCNTISNFV